MTAAATRLPIAAPAAAFGPTAGPVARAAAARLFGCAQYRSDLTPGPQDRWGRVTAVCITGTQFVFTMSYPGL